MNRYSNYLNKQVRIISVVVYRNGRVTKTEYYGKLIEETDKQLIIIEHDDKKVTINKRFVKRVDTNV